MGGDELIQQSHGFIERVDPRNEAQFGIVEQGLFADFSIKTRRIGRMERASCIFQLVGL